MALGLGSHAIAAGDFANFDAAIVCGVGSNELIEKLTENRLYLAIALTRETFGFGFRIGRFAGWGRGLCPFRFCCVGGRRGDGFRDRVWRCFVGRLGFRDGGVFRLRGGVERRGLLQAEVGQAFVDHGKLSRFLVRILIRVLGRVLGRFSFGGCLLLSLPFQGVGGKQGGELGEGDRLLGGVDNGFQFGFEAHTAVGT